MRKKIMMILIFICMMLFSACSQTTNTADAEDKIIWRLSHEESAGSMQDRYAMKFKELIEEKSDGKIQVNVYTLGQLGDSVGAVEMLRYGVVDFAINNPATVATIVPENQLFTLHFVFSDDPKVTGVMLNEGETIRNECALSAKRYCSFRMV